MTGVIITVKHGINHVERELYRWCA